jgi:hypothetical protein
MASRRSKFGENADPVKKKDPKPAEKKPVEPVKKKGGGGKQNARDRIRKPSRSRTVAAGAPAAKPKRKAFSGGGARKSIERGADPKKAAARLQARRTSVGDKRTGLEKQPRKKKPGLRRQ